MAAIKIDASGRQIHARASLVFIVDTMNKLYDDVSAKWGPDAADAAQVALGNQLIEQLEERLGWTVYELIEWEEEQGWKPNKDLTARRMRVDSTYNIDDAILQIKDQLREG